MTKSVAIAIPFLLKHFVQIIFPFLSTNLRLKIRVFCWIVNIISNLFANTKNREWKKAQCFVLFNLRVRSGNRYITNTPKVPLFMFLLTMPTSQQYSAKAANKSHEGIFAETFFFSSKLLFNLFLEKSHLLLTFK
jgi:hypothetical protein